MDEKLKKVYEKVIKDWPENEKTSFAIHDLQESERPLERLRKSRSEALSAQKLLALGIGRRIPRKSAINSAQEVLTKFKNVRGIACPSLDEVSQVKRRIFTHEMRL